MGEILIRNLDDAVVEALRRRAAASGVSIEEEARRALVEAVGLEDRIAASRRLAEVRQLIGRLRRGSTLEHLPDTSDSAPVDFLPRGIYR